MTCSVRFPASYHNMKTITNKQAILDKLKHYEDYLFEFEYLWDGYIVYQLKNSMEYINIVFKVQDGSAYEHTMNVSDLTPLIDNETRMNFDMINQTNARQHK